MLIKSIRFEPELEDIEKRNDDNVDAIIELNDGYEYIVPVITHKNLLTLMENETSDFLFPMDPMIVVKELTMDNIERAIKAYAKDDAFWLKLYHLASGIDIKTLNILRDRWFERKKLINELIEKDQSIDIENYDLIDFNINNL
jgi:uncharacterized protein YeeX (DUF496 family)